MKSYRIVMAVIAAGIILSGMVLAVGVFQRLAWVGLELASVSWNLLPV